MHTEQPRPFRRSTFKNMAFDEEQSKVVQEIANEEFEGNFSMAVRRLVSEGLKARQAARAGAGQ